MDLQNHSQQYSKALLTLRAIRSKIRILQEGIQDEVISTSLSLDLGELETCLYTNHELNIQQNREIQRLNVQNDILKKQLAYEEWLNKINSLILRIANLIENKK